MKKEAAKPKKGDEEGQLADKELERIGKLILRGKAEGESDGEYLERVFSEMFARQGEADK